MTALYLMTAACLGAAWAAATTEQGVLRVAPLAGALLALLLARVRGRAGNAVTLLIPLLAWAAFNTASPASLPRPHCDIVHALPEAGPTPRLSIEARVLEPLRPTASGARMTVTVLSASDGEGRPLPGVCGRLLVHLRRPTRWWRSGERLLLAGRPSPIRSFGNPGEFDWAGWNARRGRFASLFVWNGDDIEALEDGPPGEAAQLANPARLRERLAARLARYRDGKEQGAALVLALLVGDRSRLSPETSRQVRDAGLAHVLAISGMHMGLVAGFIFAASCRLAGLSQFLLRRYDRKRLAAVASSAGLLAYAWTALPSVSVSRASVMALLYMATVWHGTSARPLPAMALAALLCSIWVPGAVSEAGFQLSFSAVAALVVYAAFCRRWGQLSWRGRVLETAGAMVLCWLVTTPLVAQHFGRISLVGPLANLLAAPLVAAALLASAAAALIAPLAGGLSSMLFAAGVGAASAILGLARSLSALPWAAIDVVRPGWSLVLPLAALPVAVMLPPARRRCLLPVLLAGLVLASAAAVHTRYRADRTDGVIVSVGHGDAGILRMPGGSVVLVDAGGPGRGRIAVAPLLGRMRVRRLDLAVVTHVHRDHWGGLGELVAGREGLEPFELGELWYPAGSCGSAAFADLLAELRGRGTRLLAVGAESGASPASFGPADGSWRIRALWPEAAGGRCDANESSIVLWVEQGEAAVMLAADIEGASEKQVLRRWRELGLGRPLLLKVPHHGSRTSSSESFVDALRPAVAAVSSGAGRPYGLPDEEVLERYRRKGARVTTTAADGAVVFELDRRGLRLRGARPR